MRWIILLLCCLVVGPVHARPSSTVPSPRPTGWVTDTQGILDKATLLRLNRSLEAVHQSLHGEFAVVVVDSADGVPSKEYAGELFNRWGIGRAGHNDGVLFLVLDKDRRMEVEVGEGFRRRLTDAQTAKILATVVVPEFRRGRKAQGIQAGVEALCRVLRPPAAGKKPAAQPVAAAVETPIPEKDYTWPVFGGLGLVGVGLGAYATRRSRPRKCGNCKNPMRKMSEQEEDAYLDAGQKAEENLRSVDYDVWLCTKCDYAKIERYAAWTSEFCECNFCGHRTAKSSSTTVRPATTWSAGQGRTDLFCRHCKRSHVEFYTISRLEESSSSSSSSDSSYGSSSSDSGFSGGSSDGGGAGASW